MAYYTQRISYIRCACIPTLTPSPPHLVTLSTSSSSLHPHTVTSQGTPSRLHCSSRDLRQSSTKAIASYRNTNTHGGYTHACTRTCTCVRQKTCTHSCTMHTVQTYMYMFRILHVHVYIHNVTCTLVHVYIRTTVHGPTIATHARMQHARTHARTHAHIKSTSTRTCT